MAAKKEARDGSLELDAQDWDYIERVEAQQMEFESSGKGRHKVADQQHRIEPMSMDVAIKHWTKLADQNRDEYDAAHRSGLGLAARTSTAFAAGVSQFLKDFKPLTDAAQAAGPYGSLAVSVLSAVFAIAYAKMKTDDVITGAMKKVHDRLPGLRMFEEVYQESEINQRQLRAKILLAYTGILELAMQSAYYYQKPGIARWWLATIQPKKFNSLAEKVQDLISDVRLKCEELMTYSVNVIRQGNERLIAKNDILHKELADLKASSHDRDLMDLQALLGSTHWTLEVHKQWQAKYAEQLELHRKLYSLFQWMSAEQIALFMARDALTHWHDPHQSSMLLIFAVPHPDAQDCPHCWMSPLALQAMHDPPGNRGCTATLILDPLSRSAVDVCEVLAEIQLQLLKGMDPALRPDDYLSTLSVPLRKYSTARNASADQPTDEALESLRDSLTVLMQMFTAEYTVRIVVDRMDRCGRRGATRFLSILHTAMTRANCRVKIMVVANTLYLDPGAVDLQSCEQGKVQILQELQQFKVPDYY
ncbi:hypothetical protein LTR78_008517 [Recurvomyces mirabilis]|uniref:DUF7708 domain-containing protein n=1 Tax=Recurvomyces mirabilis TaxID=574656 RepID=A0AAE0WHN9_9PEZI|nr:hypothetical protein LTR78_008517 [Recurvomyces mirabilis]KAK5156268.1 hypothetical protein LTS14_005156 [Recurvomyces mirabilis]